MVVYQDESWFSGNPKSVRGYHRPGRPTDRAVEKPAHKFKGAWVLYAALEVTTGRVHRHYAPRCNQAQVRAQLDALLARYQAEGKRVLVVLWDNASWHTAKALRAWPQVRLQSTGQARGHDPLAARAAAQSQPVAQPAGADLRSNQAACRRQPRHPLPLPAETQDRSPLPTAGETHPMPGGQPVSLISVIEHQLSIVLRRRRRRTANTTPRMARNGGNSSSLAATVRLMRGLKDSGWCTKRESSARPVS